jgi:hypothetical protein
MCRLIKAGAYWISLRHTILVEEIGGDRAGTLRVMIETGRQFDLCGEAAELFRRALEEGGILVAHGHEVRVSGVLSVQPETTPHAE